MIIRAQTKMRESTSSASRLSWASPRTRAVAAFRMLAFSRDCSSVMSPRRYRIPFSSLSIRSVCIFRSLTLFTRTMSSAVRFPDLRMMSVIRVLISFFQPIITTCSESSCTFLILLTGLFLYSVILEEIKPIMVDRNSMLNRIKIISNARPIQVLGT